MSLNRLVFGAYAAGVCTGYTVAVRWSQDGFTTSNELTLTPDGNTGTTGAQISTYDGAPTNGIKLTADLTGITALQNTPTPVEFRIYFYGNGGQWDPYGIGHLGATTDDVVLYGSTGSGASVNIVSPTAETRLINLDNHLRLEAGVQDYSGAVTTTWSQVSGPGTVTFADSTAATTSASFSAEGTYVLRITATNSAGSTSKEITIAAGAGALLNGTPVTITADGLGTITARAENGTNEGKEKAFDQNAGTKWLDFSSTSWIQYASTKTYRVTSYALTSANDEPARDPKDWALLGSNDGVNWTTLDTRTGETFSARFQTKTYTVSSNAAYSSFRLRIDASLYDVGIIQLAELAITGTEQSFGAPVVAPGTAPAAIVGTVANLTGTATDADGQPQPLSSTWSKISGPGTVTFGNAAAPATTATFSAAGTYTLRLSATDGSATVFQDLAVTAASPNTAPTISTVADQTIPANGTTGALGFTPGDAETAAASLTVNATSSNTTLVPNTNITFGGSGANRTVTVVPAPNQTGNATITLTVSDGTLSADTTFTVTVTETMASWISGYSGVGSLTAATDDADGDGFANLLEYALGKNPSDPSDRPNLTVATSGNHLTLTFTPQRVSGFTYTVEASSELSNWSEASDITSQLTPGQSHTHTDSVAISGAATKRFLRLKVSQ
jgi:hypothetical protein